MGEGIEERRRAGETSDPWWDLGRLMPHWYRRSGGRRVEGGAVAVLLRVLFCGRRLTAYSPRTRPEPAPEADD